TLGIDLGFVDSLHAIGTLLHDAAAAHADVGIAHQLQAGRLKILEQVEIESPHLVRAIVRAVAGAHAAVVDHIIQAFGAVRGSLHRTYQLAGSVFALHTGHRLVVENRIVEVAGVIRVHANPVHVAAAADLVFADHRNVVLRLARDHARAAT